MLLGLDHLVGLIGTAISRTVRVLFTFDLIAIDHSIIKNSLLLFSVVGIENGILNLSLINFISILISA